MATITAASTSLADVQTAINSATAGDTVVIPNGSATWGASGAYLSVDKEITLQGGGIDVTNLTLSSSAGEADSATIRISAAAVVKSFTIIQPSGSKPTAFLASGADGWRITGVKYTGGGTEPAAGWMMSVSECYGLIDNCDITGAWGTAELIFVRGKTNSWQTAHSLGGANNVYIEDNTFHGEGYICDANDNARVVVRNNTITGTIKADGHGKHSNSLRGVRHMEVYNNTWTNTGSNFACIEMRGGTFRVFKNRYTGGGNPFGILLNEYFVISGGQTAANWPFDDGIGVGQDPKSGGSAPAYKFLNRKNSETTEWASDHYGSYNFDEGIIDFDRDVFEEVASFNGTTGVGSGTKAAMLAITPATTGVGYWVTDEGSWRSGYAGTSGQLYIWNGSAWVLNYTPYTYPHPLQAGGGGGPTSGLSDYAENVALDALFGSGSPATYYLALFTAAPADSGGGTEVSGGSYARKSVTNNSTNFPASAAGSKTLNVAQTFAATSASWGTVTHWGIFTASSGGNLVAWGALTTARAVGAANTVTIPAASLALTLD